MGSIVAPGKHGENGHDEPDPRKLTLRDEFAPTGYEDWRKVAESELAGADFDKKLLWQSPEGFTIKPIYAAEDIDKLPHLGNLPGFPPYTRGTDPLGQARHGWQVRQDSLLAAPEDVNAALREGLSRGETAIGIRLDNASRRGLDGDDPAAAELVGRAGCTLTTINALRIALLGIDLERHPITLRTGASALPVLAMLIAVIEERGLSRRKVMGAIECDPIRELAKHGRIRVPLDAYYREMKDIVEYCAHECPGIRGAMVNSSPYHNAGASITQEVALSLATGAEYLRALTERGVKPDMAAMSMTFSYCISTNLFLEIAKLRAARMLWAKIVGLFGARDDNAAKMFLHCRSSSWTKSVVDPYNNLIRATVEGFAAAVGGCDSLYIAPFDEPIGRADEFSQRLARNQQLLLAEEAYLGRVTDPAGGSYYVEALTDSIAHSAWKLLQEVEKAGGLVAALKAGVPQKMVGETAEKKRALIAARRSPIVGVSNYAKADEVPIEKSHIPRAGFLAERHKRVARMKALRDNRKLQAVLEQLVESVRSGLGNLLEIAIRAASEGATINEMMHALKPAAGGSPLEIAALTGRRAAAPFETLRARSQAHLRATGHLPKVYLVPMGTDAMRRARVEFSRGFFAAGGFDVVEPAPFESPAEAAAPLVENGARLAVLCGDDASYTAFAPEFVKSMRMAASPALVYIAGYPVDAVDQLKAAGVDGFVHIKSNVVETLAKLQDRLQVGV